MANTDEQQYNGSQYFPATADVGTGADVYLIPTDGPVVTADSNLVDEAPVNLSLKKAKDWLLGLRGAVFGDFMGAVRKTLKSLEVDGTGAVTSTLPTGEIKALSNITTTAGDLLAPGGSCTVDQDVNADGSVFSFGGLVSSGNPIGEHIEMTEAKVAVLGTGTGANDANPPQGTSMPNEQRAINIPKCSAYIVITGGSVVSFKGYGIQDVTIDGGDTHLLHVVFTDAFDDTDYTVKCSTSRHGAAATLVDPYERTDLRTTGYTIMQAWDVILTGNVDFSATDVRISIDIDGQQTT